MRGGRDAGRREIRHKDLTLMGKRELAQTDRLQKIRQWLAAGRCVPRERMLRDLEVSVSTLKRDIAFLRDRLNMPIVWVNEQAGWQLELQLGAGTAQYEIPGLWLTAEEIHALLTMQHLLANLDTGGLLGPHIAPLRRRMDQLLDDGAPPDAEVARRIRVLTVGARRIVLPHFQAVGSALLRRRRLAVTYHARGDDSTSQRELSPQRLVHYRDNWYVDAWCHQRDALRSFSVDAIQAVQVLDRSAADVPEHQLDEELGAGYGIFSGSSVQHAQLRFSPQRARWVAAERWHPNQIGRWDHAGRWLLTVPYADQRELVMDILRHVPDVEVIAPDELREEVLQRLREGLIGMGGVDE